MSDQITSTTCERVKKQGKTLAHASCWYTSSIGSSTTSQSTGPLSMDPEDRFIHDVVGDEPGRSVGSLVHRVGLFLTQRSGSDAAEDGDLVATFIDRSVSVDAATDRQGVAFLG